ncbi:hypothetical protein ASPVEDRAFT_137308 [Aspergillus versicolor CBS 583.65]|uniref:FAD-binding domain-containing protein n=1 Tax=Aspergillus versicolor CBS 583.65 TaxID=1036611 RepID=A0A1L9PUM1_ASPVE|nr:uncharacterized protein ASPVEDRAFT_137308 [Aspergillus versicolor CBS 583.65]OJJ05249.1 hypothetical protein ASPVEDRAFT_137308 [Aspergillus versicolor CBS 583.65]
MQVIIIGAGLGGLGAAISILLAGHRVKVLESAKSIGEVGAGIQCLPNSTRILQSWDIHGTLTSKASQTETCNILNWKGDLISSMDFAAAGREHGAPFNDFHRADLHGVLLSRAIELGADIQTSSEVVDITFDDDKSIATVLVKNQQPQEADLVIGADGINSRCREILLGRREPPHRTGDMAYRILLDGEDVRKDPELVRYLDEKAVNYWYGPGAHAVTYALRDGSQLNLVLLVPDNMPEEGPSTLQGYVDEMQGLFKEWDPNGAGITFEDAAVLGECLSRIESLSKDDKAKALGVYELCRKLRTETVVRRGSIQQDLNHLDDGEEQRERDWKMRGFEAVERQWVQGKRGPLPEGLKEGEDPLVWRRYGVGGWLFQYDAWEDVEAKWDVN